jgi:hypothetical protein
MTTEKEVAAALSTWHSKIGFSHLERMRKALNAAEAVREAAQEEEGKLWYVWVGFEGEDDGWRRITRGITEPVAEVIAETLDTETWIVHAHETAKDVPPDHLDHETGRALPFVPGDRVRHLGTGSRGVVADTQSVMSRRVPVQWNGSYGATLVPTTSLEKIN